jgi:hypothetical protein
VLFHPRDEQNGLKSPLHLRSARHLPQLATPPGLNIMESSIGWPEILIRKQLFPVQNDLLMTRIPTTIPLLIQQWWLIKVSTLSVVL